MQPTEATYARRGLKTAVAWRTMTEIVRHHPGLDLRIVETHSCGGTYDCLTLVNGPTLDTLCAFNVRGTGLLLGTPLGGRRAMPWPDAERENVWRYHLHALDEGRDTLATMIEGWLGFSESVDGQPPSSITGIALAVIAELLDRVALGARPVRMTNGWLDDTYSAEPRPWAQRLPGVSAVSTADDWQTRCRATARYWAIDRADDPAEPTVIVDVATSAVWVRGVSQASLADRWHEGAGIRTLAWSLEQLLDTTA